jgi:hypothetical protein
VTGGFQGSTHKPRINAVHQHTSGRYDFGQCLSSLLVFPLNIGD